MLKTFGKNRLVEDLPTLKRNMEKIDRKRKMRIKEAKDTRNFKVMIQNWAAEKKPRILSEKQRMAIYLMCDLTHQFDNNYIAAKLGIELQSIFRWKNDPLFLKELDKEMTKRKSFMKIHAYRNVNKAIMRGSMKDTWNYLKMTGDLKEYADPVDRTGESELTDKQLRHQIKRLSKKLKREKMRANEPEPSLS